MLLWFIPQIMVWSDKLLNKTSDIWPLCRAQFNILTSLFLPANPAEAAKFQWNTIANAKAIKLSQTIQKHAK